MPYPIRVLVAVAACVIAGLFPVAAPAIAAANAIRPANFVDLHALDPTIAVDMRYAGYHNFVGHPVPGYLSARCLLTRPAAQALAQVQREIAKAGLSLQVYDCYRPQRAVDYFMRWAAERGPAPMKGEFFPRTAKDLLIPRGYIASPSSHSRGSTVDLTLIALPLGTRPPAPRELVSCIAPATLRFADGSLDMGTGYDCFDVKAHIYASGLSGQQRANRLLLERLMVTAGFAPYADEWWHFTLRREPFPDTYFDFPVK